MLNYTQDDTDDFLEKFGDVMQDLMVDNHISTKRAGSLHGGSAIDKFIKKTTDRTLRDFKMEDPSKKYKLKAGKVQYGQSYESNGSGDTQRGKLGSLGSLHGPIGFGHNPKKSRSQSTGKRGSEPNINGKVVKIGVLKKNQPIPLIGNKFKSKAMNLLTKEDELRAIKSRNEMKKWIAKHKHTGIKWGDGVNELDATEKANMKKNGEGKCATFVKTVQALFKKEEFVKGVPLHLPMYAWTWQHLVSFIESEEQYKRFSSIFWEYRINGQEICNMKSKQIELLIECSVLNNSKLFETEFDEFKLLSSRTAFYQTDPDAKDFEKSNQWEISLQADELYEYIVKGRVQSQIVSRYYTAWDVVKQIANNDKHPSNRKAKHIVDLVTLLRAEPSAGPKKFW